MTRQYRSLLLFILVLTLLLPPLLLPLARGDSPIAFGLDLSGGVTVTYRPDFSTLLDTHEGLSRAETLQLVKETLSDRIARSLATVPDIVVRSDERVVVSIPNVQDHQQVLDLVGKTYRLTFRLVAETVTAADSLSEHLEFRGRPIALEPAEFAGDMMDEHSIRVELGSGSGLDFGASGPRVLFRFLPPHDQAFAEFTKANIGRDLAIVIDEEVEWVGRIESSIRSGGELRGSTSVEEAEQLALMVRSGSLPVSLSVESYSGIGPSLGQEVRDLGLRALLLAGGLLIAVVLLAYVHRSWFMLAGLVSLGLLLYFLAGLVALFGLSLDLAGIAGLVLSLGMGMDAFILIFESLGRRLDAFSKRELDQEHDRIVQALYSFRGQGSILFHANATTVLVLSLLLGSERLRSFAVFLFVGIAASVLTIFCTRFVLQRTYGLIGNVSLDPFSFLRRGRPRLFRLRRVYFGLVAGALLLVAIAAGLGSSSAPTLELGADFKPGTQLVLRSVDPTGATDAADLLRERLPNTPLTIQSLGEDDAGLTLITLAAPLADRAQGGSERLAELRDRQEPDTESMLTTDALAALLTATGVEIERIESIDDRVSSRRLLGSLRVLGLSFVLLGLYLVCLQRPIDRLFSSASRSLDAGLESRGRAWGFFGIVLAVALDLALVLGFMAVMHIEVGLAVIAALLTTIGYSVNDSVVLYGHVASRHRVARSQSSPVELVTESVDSILSRALLTSLSTIVPALAILIVGLEPLRGFALVSIAGTVAGTLSSLFVVGSFMTLALSNRRHDGRRATARASRPAKRTSTLTRAEIGQKLGVG